MSFHSMAAFTSSDSSILRSFCPERAPLEFVQILGRAKRMNPNKVAITINFGQESKFWSSKDDGFIVDSDGKKHVFYTMIDALNYMHSHGYEYVDSNVVATGQQNVYQYLLRKVKE